MCPAAIRAYSQGYSQGYLASRCQFRHHSEPVSKASQAYRQNPVLRYNGWIGSRHESRPPLSGRLAAQWATRETQIAVDPNIAPAQQECLAHGPLRASFLGAGWAAALLICTTLICLGSAATAFMLLLRPSLQNMDRATLATERAAIEMEAASKEIERAALKFQGDCDRTMPELVAVSREFQELGRNFNILGSGITDSVGRPVRVVQGAVQDVTTGSLRKVVQDLGNLTQALTPALDQWRQRILGLTARFEAVKESQPPELKAAAQQLAVAAEHMQAAAEQQESQVKAIAGNWVGQNTEEVDTNTAWLQSAQARAASFVDSMSNARNSSISASSTGPQSAPWGFRSTMIGTPQSRSATASLGASETLEQVSTDEAGILQQLRVGKSDNDEAATAAAKQGARLINNAAAAAEQMAQEARSMAFAIDSDQDESPETTAKAASFGYSTDASNPATFSGSSSDSGAMENVSPPVAGRNSTAVRSPEYLSLTRMRAQRRVQDIETALAEPESRPWTSMTSSMSEEEIELLGQLKDRKDAAQAVFMALSRAENAANAAAEASSVLESALQRAEMRGGWHRHQSVDEEDGIGMPDTADESVDVISTDLPRDGMAAAFPKGSRR